MLIGFDASRAFVLERTGTENYSYNLLRELLQIDRKNAYKIYLRLPPGKDKSAKEWMQSVQALLPKTNNYRLVLIKNKRLWTQWGLAWELRRNIVDVLFIPAHTLPFLRPKSIKTVVTIHDLGYEYLPEYHQFPQKLWLNKTTEYAIKTADRLIAVSNATKDDIVAKNLGVRGIDRKISVIYEALGSDVQRVPAGSVVDAVLKKYGVRAPFLLYTGTIQPRKNLVRLIQAFKSIPEEFQLVISGKKGWLSDDIYAEPKKLSIQDRVVFTGRISDEEYASLLSRAACFVFPSLFEGFGIPILEAQRAGVVVVTSGKRPMDEVGGVGCEYVDPESVESITQGILSVILHSHHAELLKKRGLENVKRFSWKIAAAETLQVLEGAKK